MTKIGIETGAEVPGSSLAAAGKTFLEFFAGIGLVRVGLEPSGWSCVYANDLDPKKRKLYAGRFGDDDQFHLGDVWDREQVLARLSTPAFLSTASFPCVDLSLAGKWKGLDGAHSSAFFGFTNVLEGLGERKPSLVLIENVTGFVASRDGQDFESATRSLAELGYWLDAFVLDAAHFIPQSRPRVFIVGVHDRLGEPPMARRGSGGGWLVDPWVQRIERAGKSIRPSRLVELMKRIKLPTGWAAFRMPLPDGPRRDIAELIDLDDAQDWWDEPAVVKHHDMMSDLHRRHVDGLLAAGGTHVGTIYRRKRYGKTRAETRFDGIAGCLRTPKGGSGRQIVVVVDRGRLRMRWMSPREYARLQGVDNFPLGENTIQNLYGFGDAVCAPVISWIDAHILTPVYEWAREGAENHPGRPRPLRSLLPREPAEDAAPFARELETPKIREMG